MDKEYYDWIEAHASDNPAALRLKYAGRKDGMDYASAITQIECRRRFGKKLADTLASAPKFFFPSVLSGEQATSDIVAAFHASLVGEGMPACDLTAGLGIDALHFARRASEVLAVEYDSERAEALRMNAASMHADNITVVAGDCQDFVKHCIDEQRRFATVFIDPARRAGDGSRVFALTDCEPDVVTMLADLSRMTSLLIIKASPMLDITHTIAALTPTPIAVMAVGTPAECKELLVMVDFAASNEAQTTETIIEAVTLQGDRADTFAFTRRQERESPLPTPMPPLKPGDYIYEGSPSLMKTGAWRLVAERFGLRAFHANTRLFGAHEAVDGFPGNRYRVVEVLPYASRVLKRFAREYPQINVAVRNFGISADALRARLGVRDGGNMRLYGLTDARGKKILAVTVSE